MNVRPVDQVLDQLRSDARIDAGVLAIRIDALARFRRATERYLPPEWLEPARGVTARAGERLALSRAHTVVAVAGTTGSGKSSLFNALVGMDLSPVGARRPTTGEAHACVWGPPAEAAPVLDWLWVRPENRFARESPLDADDQAGLRGLILLDLPDFDSVQRDHALEVARLLELVDLVVWVADPQKYADQLLHEGQLQRFRQHRDVTVVALNHADRLAPEDVTRVLTDLRKLLAEDGLAGVPVIASSAVAGASGLAELRATLQQAVASRRAALQRLAADVDDVVAGLSDLVGPPAPEITVDRTPDLVNGLAEAAGVPAVTSAVESLYRWRASSALGWLPLRWARRSQQPVELAETALAMRAGLAVPAVPAAGSGAGPAVPAETTLVVSAPAGMVQRAAAGLAARAVATGASTGLPPPWPDTVAQASRSRLDELPPALRSAIAAMPELDDAPTPWWWRMVSTAQWVAAGVAVLGLCWLVVGWLLQVASLPVTHPRAGAVSVPAMLLLTGLAGGAALGAAVQPLVRWAARRARARAAVRLRAALAGVGHEYVIAPVWRVLQAYEEARAALYAARSR